MTAHRANVWSAVCLAAIALNTACGGGGADSGRPVQQPPPFNPAFTITTNSLLPGAVNGRAYSTTLTAVNGQGALRWSIAAISPTTSFVNGLSIDPSTGVLSGTTNFLGTGGFIASVSDSSSPPRTTTKGFTITASPPLSAGPDRSITAVAFRGLFGTGAFVEGGVRPLNFSITSGSPPPGLKMSSSDGQLTGAPFQVGTSQFTVTVTDSFSPPEIVTQKITVKIIPPALAVAAFIPPILPLNRPFTTKIVANGGVPPYSFTLESGGLPPGMGPIDVTGNFNGTPTTEGQFSFSVRATDSDSPPSTASASFFLKVSPARGRNDTPATATRVSNGLTFASISPYIDPPNGVPSAADHDYYKIISFGGNTVRIATQSFVFTSGSLDPVLEIVDANGFRLTSCRVPDDTSTSFSSACLNDDASPSTLDAALDFQVPGASTEAFTFFAHVLDWHGNARPDMKYSLAVSGAVEPLEITSEKLPPGARGRFYSGQVLAVNGAFPRTWSLVSGTLPAGLNLDSGGMISGTPTTTGDSTFTVRVTDSSTPPQTDTAQKSIRIVEPLRITSSATLPNACVNQPYTFAVQTSGGSAPFNWSFIAQTWPTISLDQAAGVFNGTPTLIGTFGGTVSVFDAAQVSVSQNVTLIVKQCP